MGRGAKAEVDEVLAKAGGSTGDERGFESGVRARAEKRRERGGGCRRRELGKGRRRGFCGGEGASASRQWRRWRHWHWKAVEERRERRMGKWKALFVAFWIWKEH